MALKRVSDRGSTSGEMEFWISEPEKDQDLGGEWRIAIYEGAERRLLMLVYPGEKAAWQAFGLLPHVLRSCTFIEGAQEDLAPGASTGSALEGLPKMPA
jgi:hypothetical protein